MGKDARIKAARRAKLPGVSTAMHIDRARVERRRRCSLPLAWHSDAQARPLTPYERAALVRWATTHERVYRKANGSVGRTLVKR